MTIVNIRRGNQGIQRCLDTIKTLVEKVFLKYFVTEKLAKLRDAIAISNLKL